MYFADDIYFSHTMRIFNDDNDDLAVKADVSRKCAMMFLENVP